METISKIQLKIGDIEVTVEGTAEFVSEQYMAVLNNLQAFQKGVFGIPEKEVHKQTIVENSKTEIAGERIQEKSSDLPKSFDEWLGKLPAKSSGTDKILLAGYFAQHFGSGDDFKVRDATKVLKANGMEVGNPSGLLLSVWRGKRGFIEKRENGEKQTNYHFTPKGEKYVLSLMKKRRKK